MPGLIGAIHVDKDYSPDKLLPPFPKPDQTGVYGEKLMSKLLDVADVAIVIGEQSRWSLASYACSVHRLTDH